jgi:hypothetical protein
MLGTLIGAFVTASGILLSADTFVSDTGTKIGVERKVELTGQFSGAAINGQLRWSGEVSADFLRVFRDVSKALRASGPLTLRGQLSRFARALKAEADRTARPGMQKYLYADGGLLTVTVAGFEDQQPTILAFTIFLDTSTSSTTAVRFRAQEDTTLSTACWWLAGQNHAALGLVDNDPRLPVALRQNAAVQAVKAVRTPPCDALSEADALTFFQIAVHATGAYGAQFGIRPGEVGGKIDVLPITRASAGPIRRLESKGSDK